MRDFTRYTLPNWQEKNTRLFLKKIFSKSKKKKKRKEHEVTMWQEGRGRKGIGLNTERKGNSVHSKGKY